MELDAVCPFCDSNQETMHHIFLECNCISSVWTGFFHGLLHVDGVTDFLSWLSSVFEDQAADNINRIVALLWSLWKARNELVWNNKRLGICEIQTMASCLLNSWNFITTPNSSGIDHHSQIHQSLNSHANFCIC